MKNVLIRHLAAVGLAAVSVLVLSSCSTAEVKDVWTAPDVSQIKFKKVLIIAATKDGTARRTFEDAVANALPGTAAVPSYSFLAGQDVKDAGKVASQMKAAGFDGVVVMRLVSDRTEVNSTPGMAYPMGYRGFGGYYGGYAWSGDTITTDRILQVETNIYEVPGEKLIWSGLTDSTSPGNVKQMAEDAVAAIRQQLIKQKLIPAPAK